MSKLTNEIALPRFNFDNYCWLPTLDISRYVTTDYPECEVVFMLEEGFHRAGFLATEARLWMAWMEFLTNYEFLCLIKEAGQFIHANKKNSIQIPLEYNLFDNRFPSNLKLKVKQLIDACELICYFQRICEPILESISIYHVSKMVENEPKLDFISQEMATKKIRTYNLELTYPKMQNLYNKLGNRMVDFEGYVFGPLTDKSREKFPPLLISASYEQFNKESIKNISKKFDKVLNLFSQNFNENDWKTFMEANSSSIATIPTTLNQIVTAADKLPELRALQPFDLEDITCALFTPVAMPQLFFNELLLQNKEDLSNFEIYLHFPPLRIEENWKNGKTNLSSFNLPSRPHDAYNIRVAYNITDLKYFFLTGMWTNLYEKEKPDLDIIKAILGPKNIQLR